MYDRLVLTVQRVDKWLTPAKDDVGGDGTGVGEEGEEDEVVEVESLHEDPTVVGCDAVLPERYDELTGPVQLKQPDRLMLQNIETDRPQ